MQIKRKKKVGSKYLVEQTRLWIEENNRIGSGGTEPEPVLRNRFGNGSGGTESEPVPNKKIWNRF